MNQREAKALAVVLAPGLFVVLVVIAQIPAEMWVFLAILLAFSVICLFIYGIFWLFSSQGQAAYADASRKARVRSLQHQVHRLICEVGATESAIHNAGSSVHGGSRIHQIPPLQRMLAEQKRELAKVRRELQSLWKPSDGYLLRGKRMFF